jgi:hypothetical protein
MAKNESLTEEEAEYTENYESFSGTSAVILQQWKKLT